MAALLSDAYSYMTSIPILKNFADRSRFHGAAFVETNYLNAKVTSVQTAINLCSRLHVIKVMYATLQ